jgi:hypothetical protein
VIASDQTGQYRGGGSGRGSVLDSGALGGGVGVGASGGGGAMSGGKEHEMRRRD